MVVGVTMKDVSAANLKQMEKELESEAIMVEKDMMLSMYEELEKVLGTVNALLYNIIKKSTKRYAQRFIDEGILNKDTSLDAAFKIMKEYGYAKKLEVVENKDNEMTIRGEGLFFGSNLKNKKRPVDAAIAGFLAGWLETAWGKRVDVKETKCQAKGDPYCEFKVIVRG